MRIQSDSQLPKEQRRNYTGFFNAVGRIVKEEGVLALWRGSTPTVVRGTTITVVMLASYDEVKERLSKQLKMHQEHLGIRVSYKIKYSLNGVFNIFKGIFGRRYIGRILRFALR